jgi:hypothetical protein
VPRPRRFFIEAKGFLMFVMLTSCGLRRFAVRSASDQLRLSMPMIMVDRLHLVGPEKVDGAEMLRNLVLEQDHR